MIENEFYRIEVNDDGSLNILDKSNQYLYQNQAILEENGDDGDSYNYSPPRKDMHIFSTQQSYKVYQYLGKLKNQLIINFNFKIPSNLTKRAQKVADTTMPVSLEVTLTKNSKIIAFKINVDNRKSKSHRLCINFDSEIVTKTSIADMQFGTVKRQVVKEKELTLWRQETDKWQEMPISINTMQSFVAISNNTRCMAVIPQGVREYECIGKNHSIMRLTIFRTYGMLGKKICYIDLVELLVMRPWLHHRLNCKKSYLLNLL
ncbi:glycoside hydrolase family 38 C-terminal domain-containing protein [Lactobacillus bombicola]|uniref:glycoside hydrolase family 38 C-terminal domain-containing protein n=1 Tax=Lactobacillus bombicola TaxID=1505723 RepID=UPI002174ECD1|nr:glycoside hydrolase family 38 C-terminal domain-containing protein [Lactobacillus bombicola]